MPASASKNNLTHCQNKIYSPAHGGWIGFNDVILVLDNHKSITSNSRDDVTSIIHDDNGRDVAFATEPVRMGWKKKLPCSVQKCTSHIYKAS